MTASVALIHTQYGPYHMARARAFQAALGGTVDCIQLASQENLRQWQIADPIPLTTIAQGPLETLNPRLLAQGLVAHLDHTRPQVVVIAGYFYPAMRAAAAWAKRHGAVSILMSDSQRGDKPRNPLKEALKRRWLSRHVDAAFVAGASAGQYLVDMGLPAAKIWRGFDVVDNSHFINSAWFLQEQQAVVRQRYGLPDRYFLYVGRFAAEKNLLGLVQGYGHYCQTSPSEPWPLVLVGDGPQREALKQRVEALHLKSVWFPGFQQEAELPAYYALAEALILPSLSEPWGLVINEAMACGLPILASTQCGAVWDLVRPGINGGVFDPHDPIAIGQALTTFSQYPKSQRQAMGEASRSLIQTYTPDTWARALIDCIAAINQT